MSYLYILTCWRLRLRCQGAPSNLVQGRLMLRDRTLCTVQLESYGELPERVFTEGALGMDWSASGPAGSLFPGSIKFVAVYDYGLVSTQILGLSTMFAGSAGLCAVVEPGTVHSCSVLWGMILQMWCCPLHFPIKERPPSSRYPVLNIPYHSKHWWNDVSSGVKVRVLCAICLRTWTVLTERYLVRRGSQR